MIKLWAARQASRTNAANMLMEIMLNGRRTPNSTQLGQLFWPILALTGPLGPKSAKIEAIVAKL